MIFIIIWFDIASEEIELNANPFNPFFMSDYPNDGYILLDKTYKMLKKHKSFSCLKDKNLFDLLKKFYKKNKNMFYLSSGSLDIKNSIREDEIWQLENPDENLKNKKRIEKIIIVFIILHVRSK
jgi:hypothetical protein